MDSIVTFGYRPGELSRISSSIEYNFETYRSSLTTCMQQFENMVRKMDHIDSLLNGKFAHVHMDIKNLGSRVPELWEQNEKVMRYLVDTSNLNLVYSLPYSWCSRYGIVLLHDY